MSENEMLSGLEAGMVIPYGGDRVARVSAELADAFTAGDRLVVVQSSGDLIHIPQQDWQIATDAVSEAHHAFGIMSASADDAAVTAFFAGFADRLSDDAVFAPILAANQADIEQARAKGRSTTRLVLSEGMRADMISGLRGWATTPSTRGKLVEQVEHDGWRVEQISAGLGVVGFVFEGRPNVFADACGVLRSGNTVVFRIGSDALGTARAIVEHALRPALIEAGLPTGAATLVDTTSRAAGHAMFSDDRLSLAVARGSGAAVAQLGAVARQAGTSVSLHGTGGAWIIASAHADADRFEEVATNSLDRKVCNTLNTCCIVAERADELVPRLLNALDRAGDATGATAKLHIVEGQEHVLPAAWFDEVSIGRAEGDVREPRTSLISSDQLGLEWEWEQSPEITLVIVDTIDEAVGYFNEQSPRFAASIISEDSSERDRFFAMVDAPFVGDGFTRWVDGQYALSRPELGLSNWENGRLFGRGAVLAGDSVFTVRSRAVQADPTLRR